MQRSTPHATRQPRASGRHPLRLLIATAVLALAGGLMQTAMAAPHGGPGSHGAMTAMAGLGGMGGIGGMAMAHPRQVERLFDSIGASAEQRAQIRQIMESARADLKAQREAGRQLREQGQALFAQPAVDANAAEALRQQMLAQHDLASKRTLQAMIDVSGVLTPEQRKAIADRMAERRARMERHRAERGSAAKPTR
ncbi:MAG: Spy/CpxP family protein refolding chaperone [Rubrivivax sp.]|nr:Spy/CpxP family protein refolding chaperone [Rubrivivax sp.]